MHSLLTSGGRTPKWALRWFWQHRSTSRVRIFDSAASPWIESWVWGEWTIVYVEGATENGERTWEGGGERNSDREKKGVGDLKQTLKTRFYEAARIVQVGDGTHEGSEKNHTRYYAGSLTVRMLALMFPYQTLHRQQFQHKHTTKPPTPNQGWEKPTDSYCRGFPPTQNHRHTD